MGFWSGHYWGRTVVRNSCHNAYNALPFSRYVKSEGHACGHNGRNIVYDAYRKGINAATVDIDKRFTIDLAQGDMANALLNFGNNANLSITNNPTTNIQNLTDLGAINNVQDLIYRITDEQAKDEERQLKLRKSLSGIFRNEEFNIQDWGFDAADVNMAVKSIGVLMAGYIAYLALKN